MDHVLGPKELAARGLDNLFDPPPLDELAATNAAGERAMQFLSRRGAQATFTPEEDVNEELPDGRIIQVAVAGVPMSMNDAIKAGLVKDAQQPAPSETKPARPARETKTKPTGSGSSQPENPPKEGEGSAS